MYFFVIMNLDSSGARALARQIVLAAELKEVKKEETKWERRRQVCCELITQTPFRQLLVCFGLIILLFSVYPYPMRVMQQQDIAKIVERALQTAERLKQSKRDVMRKATPHHDESLWICPFNATLHTHTLVIALKRLQLEIEMQSPFNNPKLWMCPQGVPGLMANIPHSAIENYEVREHLNARCNAHTRKCNLEETIELVLWKMQYMRYATDRYTREGIPGPYLHEHPQQRRYCRRLIERYCDTQQKLPACDVFDELLSYGTHLVTSKSQCTAEALMGAAGPPADMNPYQCDVYLQNFDEN